MCAGYVRCLTLTLPYPHAPSISVFRCRAPRPGVPGPPRALFSRCCCCGGPAPVPLTLRIRGWCVPDAHPAVHKVHTRSRVARGDLPVALRRCPASPYAGLTPRVVVQGVLDTLAKGLGEVGSAARLFAGFQNICQGAGSADQVNPSRTAWTLGCIQKLRREERSARMSHTRDSHLPLTVALRPAPLPPRALLQTALL